MLKSIQKFLSIILLIIAVVFLAYQGFLYYHARSLLPQGTRIAEVDVSGLSRQEATERLNEHYLSPIPVYHRDERVEINPEEVGFRLDVENMLYEAETAHSDQELWQGFLEFLVKQSLEPVNVPLKATHDRELLSQRLQTISQFLDKPARSPQLLVEADTYQEGEPGYVTDVDASLEVVESALYRPEDRRVELVVIDQEPAPLDMNLLRDNILRQLESFNGMGSVFIMDLETGQEIGINEDLPMSGLSILKIAIFVEAYRALDGPPNDYVQNLLYETAVQSSNYGANLLLHVAAGENNTYEGASVLTESMHRLGLVNTFMAIPYDAPAVPSRPDTYTTPANSRSDLSTVPDSARQTTAEDIGTLLSMIYHCAQGGGALLAVYPEQITPDDCQGIIDLMVLNDEGNLIRFGVPQDVPVSHKHGWDGFTYGDAGIVLSPGADYVIVTYLHQPGEWLPSAVSFPILWEISRITYNYFNFDEPNLESPQERADREAAAREAAAQETAVEEGTPVTGEENGGETAVTTTPAAAVPIPTATPTVDNNAVSGN